MDDPSFKFLALIVPAILAATIMFLIPMLEDFVFQKKLIGKTITVDVYFTDDDFDDDVKFFRTEGLIDRVINDEVLVIKRRTQQSFKIPFSLSMLKNSKMNKYKTDFKIEFIISKFDKFNIQTGFY